MLRKAEIRAYAPALYSIIQNPNPAHNNLIFSHLDDNTFDFVCNCVHELVYNHNRFKLSPKNFDKIQKVLNQEKDTVLYIANKKNSRKKKRAVIKNQSGGVIPAVIQVLMSAPFIVKSLIDLFKPKKNGRK